MASTSRSRLVVVAVAIALLAAGGFFALAATSGTDGGTADPPPTQPASEFPTTATEPSDQGGSDAPLVGGVIVFIVASFAASIFLARFLLRRATRSGVIEDGQPATATVVAMSETGMTVNDHPMVKWDLEVTRDGQPPSAASVKQMLPRLLLGQVAPGSVLAVKVMPDDPTDVAIDWDDTESKAAASTTEITEGLFAGARANTDVVDSEAFLLKAIPAMAQIDQMSETGVTATNPRSGEDYEVFAFVVTVTPEGGEPYPATVMQGLPDEHRGRIGPGGEVPVGINPDDPADIAVNWRELTRLRRTEGD
jgi:hypothetical protein